MVSQSPPSREETRNVADWLARVGNLLDNVAKTLEAKAPTAFNSAANEIVKAVRVCAPTGDGREELERAAIVALANDIMVSGAINCDIADYYENAVTGHSLGLAQQAATHWVRKTAYAVWQSWAVLKETRAHGSPEATD